jgi:hypothetical protein
MCCLDNQILSESFYRPDRPSVDGLYKSIPKVWSPSYSGDSGVPDQPILAGMIFSKKALFDMKDRTCK